MLLLEVCCGQLAYGFGNTVSAKRVTHMTSRTGMRHYLQVISLKLTSEASRVFIKSTQPSIQENLLESDLEQVACSDKTICTAVTKLYVLQLF